VSDDDIRASVLDFLEEHICSIEQLEVLLLVRATAPRLWTAEALSREIGSTVTSISQRLSDLAASGLLSVEESEGVSSYHYAPATETLVRLIDTLAKTYKERRLTVINHIYGRPDSDIRSFSEAFVLKKPK
jgi:hypothetical protein